jgi:hypothetical protein
MKLNGALQPLRDEARAAWAHFSTDQSRNPVPFDTTVRRTTADLIAWGVKEGFDEKDVQVVMDELLAEIESVRCPPATTIKAGNSRSAQRPDGRPRTAQQVKRKRPQVTNDKTKVERKAGPAPRDVFQRAVGSRSGPPSPTTRLVLLRLSMYGNPDGSRIFPSVRRIAEDCGLNTSTVVHHLRAAEKQGWIQRERRLYQDGTYGSFKYTLLVPMAKCDT